MRKYIYLVLIFLLHLTTEIVAQNQHFTVKVAPFSSRIYDEFSPVFYKGGIVFCSNIPDNSLVTFKDENNRLFKLFYSKKMKGNGWKHPQLLSKEITSGFNDGPVTFNDSGNLLYFSRNNFIKSGLKNISDTTNKLGIYAAELVNGLWTNIKPFTYNNPHYSFCTPSLAPGAERIYFSSDMPGGYGGMDLYYCDKQNNDWGIPVNLGSEINTKKNESFPFICKFEKLYFASDGHNGLGGKDIYYTQQINGKWITPVHMDSAINSTADDFGLVMDSTMENGFFSSNRRKTDDIFSFRAVRMEFPSCDSLRENNYCFTFYDEQHLTLDSVPVSYHWDFGDGIILSGKEVKHCFPGPGDYTVKLNIRDELTGNSITKQVNYNVNLEDVEQVYINSYNVGLVNKPLSFDGLKSNLKNYRISDYLWNFGEGFKLGGNSMNISFNKKGEHLVSLGLIAEKDSMGVVSKRCVSKKIRIFESYQEFQSGAEPDVSISKTSKKTSHDITLKTRNIFMDDLSESQKEKIKAKLKLTAGFINFNKFGIAPESYQLMNDIAAVLKENNDIRMEMAVRFLKNESKDSALKLSEGWAHELAFYLKNKEVSRNAYHADGFGLNPSLFNPFIPDNMSITGTVEFIFMKQL